MPSGKSVWTRWGITSRRFSTCNEYSQDTCMSMNFKSAWFTFEILSFIALFGAYFVVLQPLQVCEKLKLVEKDYFGLKFGGAKRAKFWLNLRNSMSSQLTGKPPYRLYFLVKFFVKPQELQQEITRWVKQVKFWCMFCILSFVPAEWAALKYPHFTRILFVIVLILFNRRFTFMCTSRGLFLFPVSGTSIIWL